jgi:hypothetical protein
MKRNKKNVSPSISHQALKLSIGHRVGVFLHLLPFSFSLKGEFESLGAFFFDHNFRFESSKNLFLQLSLGGEK